MSLVPEMRCQSTRVIESRVGTIPRATPGTLLARRENLGRTLLTVRFDSGQTVILFPDEVEVASEDLAA